MLRITASKSAKAASDYYVGALSRSDYYDHEHSLSGQWHGQGAAMLGLKGPVSKDQFTALAEGFHPLTRKKLVQRLKANRRAGYDFTFNAPKSLTLTYEYTRDPRLLAAFQDAVQQTMLDVESAIQTQTYDQNSQKIWTKTGSLAWATFTDFEARPTNFSAPKTTNDPHLHCHVFCFAPTFLSEKNRFQAAEFGGVKSHAFYFEAAFHARLAHKLNALGYASTPTQGGRWWEIAGISQRLRDKFSRRRQEIDNKADALGIVNPRNKATLGTRTRQGKKTADISPDHLREEWMSRLSPEDIAELENAGKTAKKASTTTTGSLNFALDKMLERSSVVEDKRLFTEALRFGMGLITPEDLQAEFTHAKEEGRIIAREVHGRTYLTTPDVEKEEAAMLEAVRASAGTCFPLKVGPHTFPPALSEDGSTFSLSREQQEAISAILNSCDKITSLRGVAGAGKTTASRELVSTIEAEGKTVHVFAPSSDAVDVLRKEGFSNASTLQGLLLSEKRQEKIKDGVLFIDEAGLLSVGQMRQIFDLAKKHNARVILIGDEYQHTSVERSDVNALRILRQHADLNTAAITISSARKQNPTARPSKPLAKEM